MSNSTTCLATAQWSGESDVVCFEGNDFNFYLYSLIKIIRNNTSLQQRNGFGFFVRANSSPSVFSKCSKTI